MTSHRDGKAIVEERMQAQILGDEVVPVGGENAQQDEIVASIAQHRHVGGRHRQIVDLEDDARIEAAEFEDDLREDGRRQRFDAGDVHLADGRIGEVLDVIGALLDLVEDHRAAPQQGLAIHCERDALGLLSNRRTP